MIADAEAAYRTMMRKAEAVHLASTSKVEIIWATRIRKAKATNATQASNLQQKHQEAKSGKGSPQGQQRCLPVISLGLWSGPPSLPQ